MSLIKINIYFFLFILLFIEIYSQDIIPQKSYGEIFEKYKTIFETNTTAKYNKILSYEKNIKFNMLLKADIYSLKTKYIYINDLITLLQNFVNENNEINSENTIKFNNNIENLNITTTKFNSLYTEFIKKYNDFEDLKKSIIDFIKYFLIIITIFSVVVLAIVGIISFFVVRRQKRYYKLKEEISIHYDKIDKVESNNSKLTKDVKKKEVPISSSSSRNNIKKTEDKSEDEIKESKKEKSEE